jgi:integrase
VVLENGRLKEGELERARAEAARLRAIIREGSDPADEQHAAKLTQVAKAQEAKGRTFRAVIEAYAKRDLSRLRSGAAVKAVIERELLPYWAQKDIAAITPIEAQKRIEDLVDAGKPAAAVALLGIGKRIYNWAMTRPEYALERSPFARLKALDLIGRKQRRTRILSNTELAALWRAAVKLGYPGGALVRLLMLSAVRRKEGADAKWIEFDIAASLWTIPADRMKSAVPHSVPITPQIKDLIHGLPRLGDFLFVGAKGDKPLSGFSPLKKRLDQLMLLELHALAERRGDNPPEVKLAPWTLHDIRRTVRSHLSALPVEERVREFLLAHAPPGLHAVYDQYSYMAEKRRGLELWQARLSAILTQPESNVIAFRSNSV